MNTQVLRCILEVEKTGSVSRAAENLFMSQPSLSKTISEMEKELQITIFRRTRGGMVLTEQGKELTRLARSILQQVETIEMLHTASAENRRLTLYAPAARYVVRALTAIRRVGEVRWMQTEPEDWERGIGILNCRSEQAEHLEKALERRGWQLQARLSWQPVFIAAARHELAELQTVDIARLKAYPQIMGPEEGTMLCSDRWLRLAEESACLSVLPRMKDAYSIGEPLAAADLSFLRLCQRPLAPAPEKKCQMLFRSADYAPNGAETALISLLIHEATAAGFELDQKV
ncbi:MAG: LysR family transcriptional regulator [Clostridia bacterium]|nr:LysR family transcriptional regulator [Clostridia bacterium]